ncbi:hypothetical protein F511_16427 [Dorcoceras hygrometricum]|uniref:Uncharacterized protein n=1 Tax=Dorcoceras hygrometricum TaxID=472368 RepID=A0A2Z7AMC1_9LAMI|nr:hypothetical protein F511_16427 [Dorcoceras hygrometricum]
MHETRDNSRRLQPSKGAKELNAQLNGICNKQWPRGVFKVWYWIKELLKRSPTLPQTSKNVTGNDGNSSEKLTVNSVLGFEAKNNNREKISLSPKTQNFKIDQNRARHRIPARKLHGLPGTGPNQTLEEFRPAVTTSPEHRRSGGGAVTKIARNAWRTLDRNIARVSRDHPQRAQRPAARCVDQRAIIEAAAAVHDISREAAPGPSPIHARGGAKRPAASRDSRALHGRSSRIQSGQFVERRWPPVRDHRARRARSCARQRPGDPGKTGSDTTVVDPDPPPSPIWSVRPRALNR